jgi:hypothetical protein
VFLLGRKLDDAIAPEPQVDPVARSQAQLVPDLPGEREQSVSGQCHGSHRYLLLEEPTTISVAGAAKRPDVATLAPRNATGAPWREVSRRPPLREVADLDDEPIWKSRWTCTARCCRLFPAQERQRMPFCSRLLRAERH